MLHAAVLAIIQLTPQVHAANRLADSVCLRSSRKIDSTVNHFAGGKASHRVAKSPSRTYDRICAEVEVGLAHIFP